MNQNDAEEISRFSLNSIKGRLAETLIRELFLLNNYNVFHFGMERLLPGITGRLKKLSKMETGIRFMPDFVVQSRETGELFYLEVKYRKSGRFGMESLPKGYPYTNAWFIIVSPRHIKSIHYNKLAEGKHISPSSIWDLSSNTFFHLDSDLVQLFEKYAQDFFGNTK